MTHLDIMTDGLQQISRLLAIPLEIQDQIFEEVLGKRTLNFKPCRLKPSTKGSMMATPYTPLVDTALLRVCRQISERCTRIMYYTNTFSFNQPRHFDTFMDLLTPMQKSSLGRLEISVEQYDAWADISSIRWSKCLSLERVGQLTGLYYLRLKLNSWFLIYPAYKKKASSFWMPDGAEVLWNTLVNFQELPLEEVSVGLNSHDVEIVMMPMIEESIECVRQILLKPVTESHQKVEDRTCGEEIAKA